MRGVVQKIEETNGVNQNTGKPWSKTTYTINGEWIGDFNGWKGGKSGVVEGDTVDYEYEAKGKFKNLVSIQKTTGEAPAQQAPVAVLAASRVGKSNTYEEPPTARDMQIGRSTAVKAVVELAAADEKGPDWKMSFVRKHADDVYTWIMTGDWPGPVRDAKEVLGGQVVDEELPPTEAYGV